MRWYRLPTVRRYGRNLFMSRKARVKFELNGTTVIVQPQLTRNRNTRELMCYLPALREQGQARVSATLNGVDWTNTLPYGVWADQKDRCVNR